MSSGGGVLIDLHESILIIWSFRFVNLTESRAIWLLFFSSKSSGDQSMFIEVQKKRRKEKIDYFSATLLVMILVVWCPTRCSSFIFITSKTDGLSVS